MILIQYLYYHYNTTTIGLKSKDYFRYNLPERFNITPLEDRKIMIELLQVLSSIQKVIDNQNLSYFMISFRQW